MGTKLGVFNKSNNEFSTENELNCCMGLTLLTEGHPGFWLCESLVRSPTTVTVKELTSRQKEEDSRQKE